MKSKHFEKFNHDEDASAYDANVLNEEDPIRHGYDRLLNWVVNRAAVQSSDRVVDLGIGSGNLAARLPVARALTGVDISSRMLQLARGKIDKVELVQADLLAWAETAPEFDVLVSTYAVHHLEAPEKQLLFERLANRLHGNGRLVFGDLAFADGAHRDDCLRTWQKTGKQSLIDSVNEEFFWDMSEAQDALVSLGFRVEMAQLGELSWGIVGHRGP